MFGLDFTDQVRRGCLVNFDPGIIGWINSEMVLVPCSSGSVVVCQQRPYSLSLISDAKCVFYRARALASDVFGLEKLFAYLVLCLESCSLHSKERSNRRTCV